MEGQHYKIANDFQLERFHEAVDEKFKEHKNLIVQIFDGQPRSNAQNMLSHAMYREIAKQLYGNDMVYAKSECKLTIGVPLLRETSEKFREVYDKNFGVGKKESFLSFERKLELMQIIDVSSLLSVSQTNEYIAKIYDRYAQNGVNWTDFINKSRDALNT